MYIVSKIRGHSLTHAFKKKRQKGKMQKGKMQKGKMQKIINKKIEIKLSGLYITTNRDGCFKTKRLGQLFTYT